MASINRTDKSPVMPRLLNVSFKTASCPHQFQLSLLPQLVVVEKTENRISRKQRKYFFTSPLYVRAEIWKWIKQDWILPVWLTKTLIIIYYENYSTLYVWLRYIFDYIRILILAELKVLNKSLFTIFTDLNCPIRYWDNVQFWEF